MTTSRLSLVLAAVLLAPAAAAPGAAAPAAAAPAVYPVEEGYVDAGGVLIYYKSLGRGAPLVLLHGGPGASHDYLLPHLLPLARSHRLVFVDERGSGRSTGLEDPRGYTVEAMVEDVEAVRQGLGLGRIALLGHSYGGELGGRVRRRGRGGRIRAATALACQALRRPPPAVPVRRAGRGLCQAVRKGRRQGCSGWRHGGTCPSDVQGQRCKGHMRRSGRLA